MAYIDGDDFIDGAILSFQQANRIKDNFRLATAPANVQPGMLFSDSDDDRLYHRGAAALNELLQSGVILGSNIQLADDVLFLFGNGPDAGIGFDSGTSILEIIWGAVLGAGQLISIDATGLGFYATAPAAQPAAITDATGAGDVVDRLNSLLAAMRTLGLIAT